MLCPAGARRRCGIAGPHASTATAISGITLVCRENVCGIDPQLVLDKNGKVKSSPEMDRRIETCRRDHEGYGEILVQMNVEDTRFGVAEYVLNKHGLDTSELKSDGARESVGCTPPPRRNDP